jgi:tRNA A58 N-methylase Trm61
MTDISNMRGHAVQDTVVQQARTIQSLQAEVAALREGLWQNQNMLETINRTISTDFKEVRERIVANRGILGRD